MAVSIYDLSVGAYLQVVPAVEAFLNRAKEHCLANEIDPDTLVQERLVGDMHPLQFQIASVAHHSLGAVEGVKAGLFGPPTGAAPSDLAGLQALLAVTREGLQTVSAEEFNALEGKDVIFKLGEFKLPFTAEGFLMSFSLPNFYFHATTAYDILRMKGVPLGKRDFLGAMRMKS